MFVVIRELVHSSLVRYAGPDWIQLHSPLAAIPNDRFYPDQWALPRIGAPAGWDIETGDPSIVIAIVDTGCDPNQPDLVSQYVSGLDLLGGPVGDADDTAPGTGHGTCCAGIAAAEWSCRGGQTGGYSCSAQSGAEGEEAPRLAARRSRA